MFGRRGRFRDVVERQLALFAEDEADLLQEADAAEAAWNAVGRDEAEEAYGDYQLVVDTIADRLLDIRETYAHTLDDAAAAGYRDAFRRAARRRFGRYTSLLDDLDDA